MKIIYLLDESYKNENFIGVRNKINAQIKGFNKNNVEVDICEIKLDLSRNFFYKIYKRINIFAPIFSKYDDIKVNFNNYDCVYIRYLFVDRYFLKLLKRIKKVNSKIKIFIEIPTYPYENEFKGLASKLILLKDKIFRSRLKKYVDNIVTFSNDTEIMGIKTININNGIDLENIPLKKECKLNNQLNIISVANNSFWHGYDRMIRGIKKYKESNNKNINVNYYIVGPGEENEKLKELVEKYDLKDNVTFVGKATGSELDVLFDKSHVAIDHLGLHRKGLKQLSSLKSKEYVARGIPFILSHNDNLFGYKCPYVFKVMDDESDINVNEIISFLNSGNIPNSKNIRKDAEKFKWENEIKKIVEKI